MATDGPERSRDRLTSAGEAGPSTTRSSDPTHDALQSFAHIIQEKTVSSPAPEPRTGSSADAGQPVRREPNGRSTDRESIARRAQQFLQRKPLLGVAAGAMLGFVLGRLRK